MTGGGAINDARKSSLDLILEVLWLDLGHTYREGRGGEELTVGSSTSPLVRCQIRIARSVLPDTLGAATTT